MKIYNINIKFKQKDENKNIQHRKDGGSLSYIGDDESIFELWYYFVREKEDISECRIIGVTDGIEYDVRGGIPFRSKESVTKEIEEFEKLKDENYYQVRVNIFTQSTYFSKFDSNGKVIFFRHASTEFIKAYENLIQEMETKGYEINKHTLKVCKK